MTGLLNCSARPVHRVKVDQKVNLLIQINTRSTRVGLAAQGLPRFSVNGRIDFGAYDPQHGNKRQRQCIHSIHQDLAPVARQRDLHVVIAPPVAIGKQLAVVAGAPHA